MEHRENNFVNLFYIQFTDLVFVWFLKITLKDPLNIFYTNVMFYFSFLISSLHVNICELSNQSKV